jgi:hypothetical protein
MYYITIFMGCYEKFKIKLSNLNLFGNRKIKKKNNSDDYIKI